MGAVLTRDMELRAPHAHGCSSTSPSTILSDLCLSLKIVSFITIKNKYKCHQPKFHFFIDVKNKTEN